MTPPGDQVYDLAVIGGGVNGCGIARDAAGRGARVLLLEAKDLASGTSSASTKLIHGGLRYLEHYEFGLVREALAERERLLRIAPHIVRPMRFVMPHVASLRPRWLLRLGLFLYDHIGGRERLAATQAVTLAEHASGKPLKPEYHKAFIYSDCWVDDARLVVLNARDAADRGADVRTRCPVTGLARIDGLWRISSHCGDFHARAVVNATGPAVGLLGIDGQSTARKMRLVRGSHIVVPKLYDHGFAYFFQLPEGRVFFAIPYERDFTLIGTTDVDHDAGLDRVQASEDEIAYLCAGASRFFLRPVSPGDIVWTYSGVRPLLDDGSGRPEAATRGYSLDLSDLEDGAALLSVYGGKLTTYRHLAEKAVALLAQRLPVLRGPDWTDEAPLPGGECGIDGVPAVEAELRQQFPFLDPATANRLVRAYGRRAFVFLGDAACAAQCGLDFGHGLRQLEVDYLLAQEWAKTAEDILWRRTKLGLHFSAAQTASLSVYLDQHQAAR